MRIRLPKTPEEMYLYDGYVAHHQMVDGQTEDEYVVKSVANVRRTTRALPWVGVEAAEIVLGEGGGDM